MATDADRLLCTKHFRVTCPLEQNKGSNPQILVVVWLTALWNSRAYTQTHTQLTQEMKDD